MYIYGNKTVDVVGEFTIFTYDPDKPEVSYDPKAGDEFHPLVSGWFDAGAVLGWLVKALQEVFLGAGREALVAEIKRQRRAGAKGSKVDKDRLEKRLRELDQEVSRLVKGIRACDSPELASELADARGERDRLKAELARIASYRASRDLQAEAERLADLNLAVGGAAVRRRSCHTEGASAAGRLPDRLPVGAEGDAQRSDPVPPARGQGRITAV